MIMWSWLFRRKPEPIDSLCDLAKQDDKLTLLEQQYEQDARLRALELELEVRAHLEQQARGEGDERS